MVFRSGCATWTAMPGTAPKMPPDSVCLLCRSVLTKVSPGNISAFEQQLSFTQRHAMDLLVEVLNTKESALTRSRWMCAHCYAQLELLDKYERDRRQLEQKVSTIQSELVSAFRRAADPVSTTAPAGTTVSSGTTTAGLPTVAAAPTTIFITPAPAYVFAPAPVPASVASAAAASVVSSVSGSAVSTAAASVAGSVPSVSVAASVTAPGAVPSTTSATDDTSQSPRCKRRRIEIKLEMVDDMRFNDAEETDGDRHLPDAEDVDLLNGNDSENESDYVEINVASIAAGAETPFHDGSVNGDDVQADEEDEDDPGMEDDGVSDHEHDHDVDPLAGEMMDVKQELIGSDASDVDLDEEVPARDPLADGLDGDPDVDEAGDSGAPVVNVASLQNTLRTRLRCRPGPPSGAPLAGSKRPPPTTASGDTKADTLATVTAQPVRVSVCVVQPRASGLKTLLPKPSPGQPPPAPPPPPPLSPAPSSKPKSIPPPPKPVPVSVPSPVVSVSPSVSTGPAAAAATSQMPLFLQAVDGKLYMLPTGTQPAVSAASGSATGVPPVTLLRLPDGRLVMPGTQVSTGTVQSPLTTTTPQPPSILPTITPPAASPSTLKNLLMGSGGIMTEGVGQKKSGPKQRAAGRNFVVLPDSQRLPRPTRGPILESILQRPGSEPCPLCSLIFSSTAEVDHHLRNHSMVCSGCDHLFASRVALFEHRQTCVPSRPAPLPTPPPLSGPRSRAALSCNLCPAAAPDTAALNEHAAQAHGLLYRCPKCDCRTAELLQYAHHVRSAHAMDVPHPCNLCQTSFLRSEQREMHVRERHGPPTKLGDRPHVKDRTIDGVRLPSLMGEKKKPPLSPPPVTTQPATEDGGKKEDRDRGGTAAKTETEAGDEEHPASGMLIVKEETDLLL